MSRGPLGPGPDPDDDSWEYERISPEAMREIKEQAEKKAKEEEDQSGRTDGSWGVLG